VYQYSTKHYTNEAIPQISQIKINAYA